MSEEIKFEYLIGDQQKFKEATDIVVAIIQYGESDFCWLTDLNEVPKINGNLIALRRIIHTPTWTVADHKAETLPEVGCECVDIGSGLIKRVVHKNNEYIVVELCISDDVGYYTHQEFMNDHKPIESPEEKAARLEDEWVDAAYGNTLVFACVAKDETDRLKEHLRAIYKAQISVDLPAPVKWE